MWSKEEAKVCRLDFWNGFKRHCSRNGIYRKWVLTGVKIKSTQLKFYADEDKALVLFQIDHKNTFRRYEIYEIFQSYRKLMAASCGSELQWQEDYIGIDDAHPVSAIYFELPGKNIYRSEDWEEMYSFFAEKMVLLEDVYWEYKDLINARLKNDFHEC